MIKALIENKIKKRLPMVWPLHQFVAFNPLWERIDTDLLQLTKSLHAKVGLQATLSLSRYHGLYRQRAILDDNLKAAIHVMLNRQLSKSSELQAMRALLESELFNFMTSHHAQNKFEDYEKEYTFSEPADKLCLLSYQIRPYCYDDSLDWVRMECLRWVAAFFDHGQAPWPMPCEHFSLFEDWRRCLSAYNKRWKRFLAAYPEDVEGFIEALLTELKIPSYKREDYFFEITWQLRGWAGYIKWLNAYPDNPWTKKKASLDMLVAMWLAYECFFIRTHRRLLTTFFKKLDTNPDLWGKLKPQTFAPREPCELASVDAAVNSASALGINSAQEIWVDYLARQADKITGAGRREQFLVKLANFPIHRFLLRWIWQTAWEARYQQRLLAKLNDKPVGGDKMAASLTHTKKPLQAQWLFCIDTRSERLRYRIEKLGAYQTFGFAGFFGFTFRLQDPLTGEITFQCPALMTPEQLLKYNECKQASLQKSQTLLKTGIKKTKQNLLTPFALFEVVGCLFLFKLLFKTMSPLFARWLLKWGKAKKRGHGASIASPFDAQAHPQAFNLEQVVDAAEQLLRVIGLTEDFAEFIIICGHRASSDNNPYQAGLDCGACGGNGGHINAVIACQAFNQPAVRQQLAARGIHLPETTKFIAACHDTTTDTLAWVDEDYVPGTQDYERLQAIKSAVKPACQAVRAERVKQLYGEKNVFARAINWAELIPEMGLANNAAIIIGPRWLTQNNKLDSRVFLHSYEPAGDPTGERLESILTAPLFVAHWINMQYYLSTTDPQLYGSGNKAIHNVIGQLGIMEGNRGDLQIGLPIQSVFHQSTLIHEPMRLFAVIYAKRALVDAIIAKHPALKALVDGHWIFLHQIEPD